MLLQVLGLGFGLGRPQSKERTRRMIGCGDLGAMELRRRRLLGYGEKFFFFLRKIRGEVGAA